MHLLGANLHLHRFALGTDHSRVQAAVEVVFGVGDVVVKFAVDGPPQAMHHAQGRIAVAHRADNNAEAVDVVDLLEGHILALHLAVDAVDVFGATVDFGFDALRVQGRPQQTLHFVHPLDTLRPLLGHRVGEFPVDARLQIAEAQILQFPFDLPDAQPVGKRSENFQSLSGNPSPLVVRLPLQRAHIVQPVGQFDQHHPHIFHHRQKHLAQGFSLLVGHAVTHIAQLFDAVELRHPIHQIGDLRVEVGTQIIQSIFGIVFHHIVKQTRGQGVRV